jgi:hypothetical protein
MRTYSEVAQGGYGADRTHVCKYMRAQPFECKSAEMHTDGGQERPMSEPPSHDNVTGAHQH